LFPTPKCEEVVPSTPKYGEAPKCGGVVPLTLF